MNRIVFSAGFLLFLLGSTVHGQDTSPPELQSITISPASVDVTTASAAVTVTEIVFWPTASGHVHGAAPVQVASAPPAGAAPSTPQLDR